MYLIITKSGEIEHVQTFYNLNDFIRMIILLTRKKEIFRCYTAEQVYIVTDDE